MATVPIKMNSINIDISQKETKIRSKIYDVIVDDEYSDIDLNNNELEKQENDSQLLDVLAQCGATVSVFATSVLSGAVKLFEKAADCGIWLGGAVSSGVARIFGDEELATQIEQKIMDTIAYDAVGEVNKYIYEETELGKLVNDYSYMKYDSEGAQVIQKVTEEAILIAAATAATIATGGVAGTVLIGAAGFAYGAGESAEVKFQNVENRNFWKDSLGVFINGASEAVSTIIKGKMGSGLLRSASFVKRVGINPAKRFFKENFGKIVWNSLKETATRDIGGFIESGTTVTKHAFSWIQNKEVTLKDVGLLGFDLVKVFGANWFYNFVGEGSKLPIKYTNGEALKRYSSQIRDFESNLFDYEKKFCMDIVVK